MDYAHQRYYEKQANERRQIAEYKSRHPLEWAAKMSQIQREDFVKTAFEAASAQKRRQAEAEAEAKAKQREYAMVTHDLPRIANLDKFPGRIALRQWDINSAGWLISNGAGNAVWKSVMIADRIPTHTNSNGLYCIQITADGLMSGVGGRVSEYCGLIELRGHCEVHNQDNVIRAEWARILTIFVLDNTTNLYAHLPQLMEHYPNVPIHVTNRSQVAKYLLRIAMWQETGDPMLLYT